MLDAVAFCHENKWRGHSRPRIRTLGPLEHEHWVPSKTKIGFPQERTLVPLENEHWILSRTKIGSRRERTLGPNWKTKIGSYRKEHRVLSKTNFESPREPRKRTKKRFALVFYFSLDWEGACSFGSYNQFSEKTLYHRSFSSVGRALVCWAGRSRGFHARPGQPSGITLTNASVSSSKIIS